MNKSFKKEGYRLIITGIVFGVLFTLFFLYIGIAQFLDENPKNNVIFSEDPISIALAAISAVYFFGVVAGIPIKILRKEGLWKVKIL